MKIPFNRPFLVGTEMEYVREVCARGHLSGSGLFTQKCQARIEARIGCRKALLTQSGTAALEMAAILANVQPGDEVIMPSYTFVSTANAFVLRGATPVFVDIRADTLNIDESSIERAITPRTRAIVVVHYAGVGCEMDRIMEIANRHGLLVIEDAAHGFGSKYRGRPLGSIGHLAAFSFHETKNIHSGEGGALLINDARFVERAEVIWEKGTDRVKFARGEVSKYTWVDVGSSFLPSEITAAFLWAQLEAADKIAAERLAVWERYDALFRLYSGECSFRVPFIPPQCAHNAHIYYLLLLTEADRDHLIQRAASRGIQIVIHYVPLHASKAGLRYARVSGEVTNTENAARRLARLPLWIGMDEDSVADVSSSLLKPVSVVSPAILGGSPKTRHVVDAPAGNRS